MFRPAYFPIKSCVIKRWVHMRYMYPLFVTNFPVFNVHTFCAVETLSDVFFLYPCLRSFCINLIFCYSKEVYYSCSFLVLRIPRVSIKHADLKLTQNQIQARCVVVTPVTIQMFWDVTPCSQVDVTVSREPSSSKQQSVHTRPHGVTSRRWQLIVMKFTNA